MKITLRQIEVFLVLAQHLHFGKAAEELHVSQATVSDELKRLEIALGLTLITRSTRRAELTAAGHALCEKSREVVQAVNALHDHARLFRDENLSKLRIVASPSVVNGLLPEIIRQTEAQYPDVAIEEIAVESGEVIEQLVSRKADIGMGRLLTAPLGYRCEELYQEEYVAVISRNHPLATQQELALPDLSDVPLLLWPREHAPEYYDALIAMCEQRELSPMVLVSPPRIVGTRSYLLSDGRAFSLVPTSATDFLPGDVVALRVSPPATLGLDIVYRERDPRPNIAHIVELITRAARK